VYKVIICSPIIYAIVHVLQFQLFITPTKDNARFANLNALAVLVHLSNVRPVAPLFTILMSRQNSATQLA
jgi:hypothetical protein